jgi:hypothetical protein
MKEEDEDLPKFGPSRLTKEHCSEVLPTESPLLPHSRDTILRLSVPQKLKLPSKEEGFRTSRSSRT